MFGSLLSGAGSLISSISNLGFGMANLDYQKKMQKEAWRREDTAVQRRARDMQAAGINPLLAAGSPAAASSPIHTTAPEMDDPSEGILNALQGVMNLKTQRAGLRRIEAEVGRTEAETERIKAEARLAQARAEFAPSLAQSEERTAFWKRGKDMQEFLASSIKRDLIERFGVRQEEAETRSKETAAKLQEYVVDWSIRSGQGPAQGIGRWLELVKGVVDIMAKAKSMTY